MDSPTPPVVHSTSTPEAEPTATSEHGLLTVSSLLDTLNDPGSAAPPLQIPGEHKAEINHQNRLIQVRLGIASSLFTALRVKHTPTALHCLRVALHSSSWGQHFDMSDSFRDEIEVAALLHDIGKIGVPDAVLTKPGKLTRDEVAAMDQNRLMGQQILHSCCASQSILDIVKYTPAWFNGRRPGFDLHGNAIPLGARLVAILDAFDSMTTDHVYRRAMSRDQAIAELYKCAGTQFDPKLVSEFCELLTGDQITMSSQLTNRWLRDLSPQTSNGFWRLIASPDSGGRVSMDILFHQKLLNSMHDGVVFVDTARRILLWNRAAERLTGISSHSVIQRRWTPRLIGMRGENGEFLTSESCPIGEALASGVQTLRRLSVRSRSGRDLSVDAHLVPVLGGDGILHGATLLLHDASSQISLEQRVQTLHQKATRDPLTKVANRAEFDRVLAHFVASHLERHLPCALIICDVDHFKQVNDTYGHPAGDEVLVEFAALLQRSSDPADLVARYGGEEFVMLCADCTNAVAAQRADAIRQELSELPLPSLGNRSITASFGVTEIQAGDTPMTMLRRADRALLQAKANGRNRVVQLGNGSPQPPVAKRSKSWLNWLPWADRFSLLEETLVTSIPVSQATERLRGFVSDHHAEILSAEGNQLVLESVTSPANQSRRSSDRSVSLLLSLQFNEVSAAADQDSDTGHHRTLIRVSIHPARARERRRNNASERARQLLESMRSYLSAQEFRGALEEFQPTTHSNLLSQFIAMQSDSRDSESSP
jgi:diguanylate cyclase (GGDEF)-like protein/PAS domain S-box-containing protein